MAFCSSCGKAVAADAKYCAECGSPLIESTTEPASTTAEPKRERVGGLVWYLAVAGFLVGLVLVIAGLPGLMSLRLSNVLAVAGGVVLVIFSRRAAVRIRDGQQRKIDE